MNLKKLPLRNLLRKRGRSMALLPVTRESDALDYADESWRMDAGTMTRMN